VGIRSSASVFTAPHLEVGGTVPRGLLDVLRAYRERGYAGYWMRVSGNTSTRQLGEYGLGGVRSTLLVTRVSSL
jgi:hypothetical protein